ncbi:MAG: Coenzyme A biosynthesis bifunctional protein CoaBC [Bacteroidetes bacterium ADurb.Bin141]|nr:MAG: phosphopantothenoylcysteine decarboxylase [Bacteroidetes bacterium OLB10]MBE7511095.1 bifunctional phosphopantothenoylcysteine decarboxylase/phosphopantothenate--cysteine ligase CoaBC [Bacteroidia bacterium]MBX3105591.1 bifunctional phosphopantothenoylcysteine decarboxylase/phosphopantothenate--cysteine ligase CoaBC [Bacteroidota bacterium]OQB60989.1 MAG: Coenzyme A biosynthesis bifunctional protein CoaBC [Bacteroidetes bacterium ADurb.Bin141]MCB8931156.1 bifunctional phosphopantothenoy
MLQGKKILLGVTGSIAAYKTPELVRQLVKQGAQVKVVLTNSASDFVSPLVLSTVSKNNVYQSFANEDASWNNHVELGLWCDLFVIAPASANTIAKMANGSCDNLLTAIYLSCRAQVMIAPAMDVDMFQHSTTQQNLKTLSEKGILQIGPEKGELASGLNGEGRMSEPDKIVEEIIRFFNPSLPLKNKKAIVTAGPTTEAIDPVRFIGNHSSGKMGIAIANMLHKQGAEVTLIVGPGVATSEIHNGIKTISITSAEDMLNECQKIFSATDMVVLAAAVADYKPAEPAQQKIKKKGDEPVSLTLTPTTDIAATLGKQKKKGQILVGFALETTNGEANAVKKLKSKNLDFIVLNMLDDDNKVFGSEFNRITIIDSNEKVFPYDKKTKEEVAADIVNKIITLVQ